MAVVGISCTKKSTTMLTVWKLLNRLFMSKFVKILFPVENQYFDKILERLTANP